MSATIKADDFLLENPYGRASGMMLSGWWAAAAKFCTTPPDNWTEAQFSLQISTCFAPVGRLGADRDPHLAQGMIDSLRKRSITHSGSTNEAEDEHAFTRPYLLLLRHFQHPQVVRSLASITEQSSRDRRPRQRQYLFSPLYFLRQILTSPLSPSSDAYAHAVIRAEIFASALALDSRKHRGAHPKGSTTSRLRNQLTYGAISNALARAESDMNGRDTFHPTSVADFVVGHILASRGLALLGFSPARAPLKGRRKETPILARDEFIKRKSILPGDSIYEFRFLDEAKRLPSASELMNEVDGIPIAIPGASAVFAGGLRVTTSNGVVGRISGQSGTGKTTLGLAVASALAPLGVTTIYLSCEEDQSDLTGRLSTITPQFISKARGFPRHIEDWFIPDHINQSRPNSNLDEVLSRIREMLDAYRAASVVPTEAVPFGLTALLVVLDGVHELLDRQASGETERLRELIDELRALGAVVLMLTADVRSVALAELDYLVDFVIRLETAAGDLSSSTENRRFVLQKTRLQYSQIGSHTLHISRRDGVRIYPQLAAQLDAFSSFKWPSMDRSKWYDFLQAAYSIHDAPKPMVRIYERSHVLVEGRGSTGKALFGLKLLTRPTIGDKEAGARLFKTGLTAEEALPSIRNLLVVSFLYQADYYRGLINLLERTGGHDSHSRIPMVRTELDVLDLYPGFLAPEILLRKILGKFEYRRLHGCDYHGVLIDGLHNVYLQYPRLQSCTMFWPTLFEVLRTLGPTIVTTHTHFDVKGMVRAGQLSLDVEAAVHRIAPLLQVLANSSDYYLDISEQRPGEERGFPIDLVSALGQPTGSVGFSWNRQTALVEYHSGARDSSK